MNQPSTDSIRVLHVDDEPDFASLTSDFLEREDDRFIVETATSAREGLTRVDEREFDCIVSDYDMPGDNGIEFLHAVREIYPDLPFILFTGKGSEDLAATAIEAGVDSYLQKQRGTDQYVMLANRIRNHVEQYREKEQAARIKEEYKLVAKTATDVFWTIDISTGEQTLSYGIEQFGYDPEQIEPDKEWWYERLHPDDRERIRTADEALFDREEAAFDEFTGDRGWFSNEYRWQRADGTYAYCRERGVVLFEGEEAVKMVGTMSDITERKQREHELERMQTILREMEQLADIGAYEVVLESEDIIWTDGMRQIFEVSDDFEPTIENSIEFYHPDEQDRVEKQYEQRVQNGGAGELQEAGIITANGDERWIHTYGNVVEEDDRRLLRGFVQDITERVEAKQELEQKNERLEEFASVVSHDLRNPLNVAQGRLKLVREDCESEQLDTIARAHERIERLIDDLLTLARQGESVNEIETVDLCALSEYCWQNVRSANATLVADTEQTILADPLRLQQLLENFFRNAVEHGDDGVTVKIGPLDERSGFYVADDGPGIPEDKHEKVFEDGYSTTEDGTGLGLSIIEQVVKGHGWNIRLTNSSAGGTRFEISNVDKP